MKSGLETKLHNTNQGRFCIDQLPNFDCLAVGTPDYLGFIAGGVKQFIDDHYIADARKGLKGLTGKPYILFYSYASKESRIPEMLNIFKRLGQQVGDPLGCQGKANQECLDRCRALGRELAKVCYLNLASRINTV